MATELSISELRAEVSRLLSKPPDPSRVAFVQRVRAFKKAAEAAQKAKSKSALETALNTLKEFYA